MTSEYIVSKWLLIPETRMKLPVVGYSKDVFDFIVHAMECHSFGADDIPVYKVGNNWEKVVCKE